MINEHFQASMREAARLIRAGQLRQATAAIQRALHDGEPARAGTAASDDPGTARPEHRSQVPEDVLEGSYERIDQTTTPNESTATASTDTPSVPENKRWTPNALLQELEQVLPRQHAFFKADKASLNPGPAPHPPGARFLALTHAEAAGVLDYKLYIPSHYQDGEKDWSLVVMLHGCHQNPDDFAAGSRMNQLAEEFRCLVVYPAQATTANPLKCWNWFQPSDQQRDQGEPAMIAGLTRDLIATYAIDPKRVFIAGLSAGGAMAAVLGANYPELFAAVGVHSGLACGSAQDLPSALTAMRQGSATQGRLSNGPLPALIVFHGERDGTVHPVNGDQLMAQWQTPWALEEADTETTTSKGQVPGGHAYTRQQIRDKDGKVCLEHWQIHGADHAWSGGSEAGSYTDPQGPDASRAMLQFFYQQT